MPFRFCFHDQNLELVMGIPAFLTFRDSALRLVDHKPECRTGSVSDPPPPDATSTADPHKKDPLRVWQEMKQNGFLSPGLGVRPAPDQPSSSKSKRPPKSCLLNSKAKVPKREKAENVTRVSAPIGLLDKLEPGIIGRVRTSRQVFSIIKSFTNDTIDGERKGAGDIVDGKGEQPNSTADSPTYSEVEAQDFASIAVVKVETEDCKEQVNSFFSSTMISKSTGVTFNKELNIHTTVPSISQDPNAVSEWLQLIQRDIARRLAALRSSKTRIQEVIKIELPYLLNKEFPLKELSEQCPDSCSLTASSCLHKGKWISLFDHMEKELSEEEKLLEVWSNQVSEMQSQCKQSFRYAGHNAPKESASSEV